MSNLSLSSDRVEANDAIDAVELYYEKGWTDGLPIVPPTPQRVQEFLDQAVLAPDVVIGEIPTRSRVITAEKAAINAVMAGCLPEYFPVVVAAIRALTTEAFNLHGSAASTMGSAQLIVVNGPIRERIGLNSGANLFGPGVRANATIGRAVRLVLMNVSGATPGIFDMAVLGQPAKYTYCIAEEEHPDTPWLPLHAERGLSRDQSAVTVFPSLPAIQITALASAPEVLLRILAASLCNLGPLSAEVVIVLPADVARTLIDAGWTKARATEFLFETARRTESEWARARFMEPDPAIADQVRPAVTAPERIILLSAGGRGGPYVAIVPTWGRIGFEAQSVTVPIEGGV
jgi:hypothetical protein